ncbi:hypothetical protein PCK1_001198 [Pneumocystis canis]|nr:hypothetical protein PCK1_001198 [Pneumocystis canis]
MLNSLNERIKSHNESLEEFVSLIPSKYYYSETLKESWKRQKQTKEKARYLRKLKFDPDSQINNDNINIQINEKNVLPLFKLDNCENENNEQENVSKEKESSKNGEKTSENIIYHTNIKISKNIKNETNHKSLTNKESLKSSKNDKNKELENDQDIKKKQETQTQKTSNIFDLRAKLASRIEQLRANRKASKDTIDESSKNKDSILKTRKRERAQRKKKEFTKIKKETIFDKTEIHNNTNNRNTDEGNEITKSEDNNLLYGRITFAPEKENEIKPSRRKYQSMDLMGALRHAEAKRIRLDQLSDEKKKQIMESDAWKKAILQSQGKKIKDNEMLLRKSIKRQERQKKKSAKAWNERLEKLSKIKQLQQKKRQDNIEAHRVMRKKKRLKKKHQRPGFEGSLRIKGKKGNERLSTAPNPRWDETSIDRRRRSRHSPRYQSRSRSWTPRRSYSPRNHSPSLDNPSSRRRRSRSPLAPLSQRRPYESRQAARNAMVNHIRGTSQQDRRVYIGNLSYDVKWHHLKDFMRQAGDVIFADVLMLPNGMSKVHLVAEYATRDEAQNAINTLSNQTLMGRMVYVREDREQEPRFGGPSYGRYPPYGNYYGDTRGGSYNSLNGRQLFIQNLPYNVGWKDIKDLFWNVIRTDIHLASDGRPKGTGIVLFETIEEARNAKATFNRYEWQGRIIEVREDRYPGPPSFGNRGFRGGYDGGFRGGYNGKHNRNNFDNPIPPNDFTDGATGNGDPSETIYVRNLPWSTSNEDLVELFTTIGKVERAEIQYEPSGRSKGAGVVRFDTLVTAQTAISKFQGYEYGGRPLGLSFVKYFSVSNYENSTNGNDAMPVDTNTYQIKQTLREFYKLDTPTQFETQLPNLDTNDIDPEEYIKNVMNNDPETLLNLENTLIQEPIKPIITMLEPTLAHIGTLSASLSQPLTEESRNDI